MNETRRKPTTGRQSPSLCDKWHGIFYMPSRIDEAGHTKAFDYPVAGHWGEADMFSSAGGTRTDNTSVRSRTCYQLSHPGYVCCVCVCRYVGVLVCWCLCLCILSMFVYCTAAQQTTFLIKETYYRPYLPKHPPEVGLFHVCHHDIVWSRRRMGPRHSLCIHTTPSLQNHIPEILQWK